VRCLSGKGGRSNERLRDTLRTGIPTGEWIAGKIVAVVVVAAATITIPTRV
jgi:hypothetical protein